MIYRLQLKGNLIIESWGLFRIEYNATQSCPALRGNFHYLSFISKYMANLGKNINRKMIIVILYNLACAYQGIWDLEKCKKYIDGVIFNIDKMFEDEKESHKKLI